MMLPAAPNSARRLVMIMLAVVVIVVLISRQYYREQNRWVDPRIAAARKLYTGYDALAAENDHAGVLQLLDTIGSIYNQHPHYHHSYELGVLENNRAAVYLTRMVAVEAAGRGGTGAPDDLPLRSPALDSLANRAEAALRNSITLYEDWIARFGNLPESAIRSRISEDFLWGMEELEPEAADRYLDQRVKEIAEAQREVPRRLSVACTNLGVVYRYRQDYEAAVAQYRKALALWEDNLSAENNLNHLLGLPLKKRSVFRKLFPGEK